MFTPTTAAFQVGVADSNYLPPLSNLKLANCVVVHLFSFCSMSSPKGNTARCVLA